MTEPFRELILDDSPTPSPPKPTPSPPKPIKRKRKAKAKPVKPKRKQAAPRPRQKGDPRDGAIWTNVLNGVEYKWNARRRLYITTGRRGIGMLD